MTDYKDLSEVLDHIEGTQVISLIDYAYSLEDPLLATLKPNVPGLYIPGEFEPIFKMNGEQYFTKNAVDFAKGVKATSSMEGSLKNNDGTQTEFKTSNFKGTVVDQSKLIPISKEKFLDIPRMGCDIYRSDMSLVASKDQMRKIGRYLKTEPTIPAQTIKMAIAVMKEYLELHCPHASTGMITYNQWALVKPEHHDMIHQGEYSSAFFDLLEIFRDLTRNSGWNLYFMKLQGTSLIINKGIDWRIYEYYRMKFEKEGKDKLWEDQ